MKTLMLAAVLLGMVAVSKDPNGIKGDNKSNAQGSETKRQHNLAAAPAVTTTTPPQPVPNHEASGVDPKAARHDVRPADKPWFDSQFWFNLLLVIFTGLLAALAYRQLRAMHRQADLMSGQLASMNKTGDDTHNLAIAMNDAAKAAEHQNKLMMLQVKALVGQNDIAILSFQMAKASVDVTRRQLEAYERPWLTASIPPANPRDNASYCGFWPDGRAVVRFPFVIKNIGKAVATNISFVVDLVVIGHGHVVLSPERRIALSQLKSDMEEFSLFPGDDTGHLVEQMAAPKADIEVSTFTLMKDGAQLVSMAVIGRIIYRYATSDFPSAMEYMSPGTTVEGDDVAWLRTPGDHAD